MLEGRMNWTEIPATDQKHRVPSIDETLDAVSSNGGKVVKGKTDIVEGKDWFAIFEDPAGNHLALYESASEG